jgi:hypothetical protein
MMEEGKTFDAPLLPDGNLSHKTLARLLDYIRDRVMREERVPVEKNKRYWFC